MYYVYVLRSGKDGKFYIGWTSDLKRRMREHHSGNNTSTSNRRPLALIYYEAYLNKQDAAGREKFLKGGSGKKYLHKQLSHYLGGVAQPVRAAES